MQRPHEEETLKTTITLSDWKQDGTPTLIQFYHMVQKLLREVSDRFLTCLLERRSWRRHWRMRDDFLSHC